MHAWALHFALLPFVYFGRRSTHVQKREQTMLRVPWIMSVFSVSVQALLLPTIDAWSEASGQWRKARAS
jgi:hypothetical protein